MAQSVCSDTYRDGGKNLLKDTELKGGSVKGLEGQVQSALFTSS